MKAIIDSDKFCRVQEKINFSVCCSISVLFNELLRCLVKCSKSDENEIMEMERKKEKYSEEDMVSFSRKPLKH